MTVQTTYKAVSDLAYPGLIADNNPFETISKKAEGAIDFGMPVKRGTDEDQVIKGGPLPIGIAVRHLDAEDDSYADEETVTVLRMGYVYLDVSETGSAGDALNVVDATGVIGVGAAGAGESDLPATLEQDLAAPGIALCRYRQV